MPAKHCCYGNCNSDSRYKNRPHMSGVKFFPFPKPFKQPDKCLRWIQACGRPENGPRPFNINTITKNTYICSKHFIGKAGPTPEYPDPIALVLPELYFSHDKDQVTKMPSPEMPQKQGKVIRYSSRNKKRRKPAEAKSKVSKEVLTPSLSNQDIHDQSKFPTLLRRTLEHETRKSLPSLLQRTLEHETQTKGKPPMADKEVQTALQCVTFADLTDEMLSNRAALKWHLFLLDVPAALQSSECDMGSSDTLSHRVLLTKT